MTSLEDVARTISANAAQNGFQTSWSWNGDDLTLSFTGSAGRPGPEVVLRRDPRRQTVASINGKRFGHWPDNADHVPWGRFWRAVRDAATPKKTISHEPRGR